MEDKILFAVARLLLTDLGANAVRIMDHGVDVKHPAGDFRIEVVRA